MLRLHRGLIVTACILSLAVPLPAAGTPSTRTAASSIIDAGLAPAVARLAAAQNNSNAAEFRRRADEASLSSAVVTRMLAVQELAASRHELALARFARVRAERALAREEAILGGQVVETYRVGGPAARAEMAWRVLTESSNPLEAARAMDELGLVIDFQSDIVADRRADLATARRTEGKATTRFNAALTDEASSRHAEELARDAVDGEIARAIGAERTLLAAIGALFAAEDELIVEGHDPADVVAASGLWLSILPALREEVANTAQPVVAAAAAADEDIEEPVALGDRREWLDNRLAALQRDVALTVDERSLRDDWVCPLPYGSYSNDWHYPRSHGRRHKGLDMFSTVGTPIVAIHAGFVVVRDETDHFNGEYDLGGVTVTIATRSERPWRVDESRFPADASEPTEEWYYAHLDGIADGIEEDSWVEAGQVIGYVGDTGNARGTDPHLHLGFQVGNRNVNPHPSIAVACDPARPAMLPPAG